MKLSGRNIVILLLAVAAGFCLRVVSEKKRAVNFTSVDIHNNNQLIPKAHERRFVLESEYLANSNRQQNGILQGVDYLKLRSEGYYVLDTDNPNIKSRLETLPSRAALKQMEARRDEYKDLYSLLGIDDKSSEKLLYHLEQIYKAKVLASITLTSMQKAQSDYDRAIAGLLKDKEKYQSYKSYETSYPTKMEYKSIEDLAAERGLQINANDH